MTLKIRILSLAMILFPLYAFAGEESNDSTPLERPVTGSYRVEIGTKKDYTSYLSPFSYSGTNYSLSGYWTKVLPSNPRHMAMWFETRLNIADMLNPSHTAREIDLHAHFQWGLEWQKRFAANWTFSAGGAAGFYGGVVYLPRNGNNPVSPQFAAGISLKSSLTKVVWIKSLPILLSERITLPLFSGFFCQEYGEPFYEIYLGNHKGLAHFGWPGNRAGIDNLLMVTLDFGRTSLELGYRFSMQNEQANNLTTRFFNNAFVIGVVPGGIGLKSRRQNIITPLY